MKQCFLLLCLLLPCLVQAELIWEEEHPEGFSVHMQLSKREIESSDQLTLSLELNYPESYTLDLADIRKQFMEGQSASPEARELRIVGERQEAYSLENGRKRQQIHFDMEAWLSGSYPTQLHRIRFVDNATGKVLSFYPDIVEVKVSLDPTPSKNKGAITNLLPVTDNPLIELDPQFKENLLDDQEQRSREAERNQELFEQRSFPWRWLLALLAIALLGYLLKRWSPYLRQAWARSTVPPDPRSKAMQALQQLIGQRLPEQGLFEPFYVQLTSIVRHFVEDCYHVQAPEQTTEEFLACAVDHPDFRPEEREALGAFLTHADLVKFARLNPSIQDCEQAVDSAKDFVS